MCILDSVIPKVHTGVALLILKKCCTNSTVDDVNGESSNINGVAQLMPCRCAIIDANGQNSPIGAMRQYSLNTRGFACTSHDSKVIRYVRTITSLP